MSPSFTGSCFLDNKLEFFWYKIAMGQGFRYSTSSKWNSQSDRIVSSPFEVKAFGFFQTWSGSSRFSADAHRHQVFSWTVFQAGWSLVYSPLELVHRRLSLGCDLDYSSPSTSPSYIVHQTLFGESLLFYICYDSISDYLLCRSLGELPEIQVLSTFLWFSFWCEDRRHMGGI